jgi:PAS domain S-box-containing protein
MVLTNEDGEAAGIFPEVLGRLLEDLDYEVRFVTGLSFGEAYDRVVEGNLDLLPAAVYSAARGEELSFNQDPIVVAWGQLGVLPNRDFDGLLELRGRRIGLMRGGQNAANFVDLMARFDIPFKTVYFDNFTQMTDAVLTEEIAAGVYFNAWFRSEERIVPSSIVFSPTQGLVATAKGENSALLSAIDEKLRTLKQDPDSYYYEILNHWLGDTEAATIPRWVWIGGAATAGALVIAAAFVLLLRRQVKRATVEIERSRERYRTVADYAHGWEFWLTPEGGYNYVSPDTEKITGYPASAFCKDPSLSRRVIVEEDRPIWDSHLQDMGDAKGTPSGRCTFRIRTKDGEVRWMEHRCNRIASESGEYLGRRGTNIDITERVVQQQALEQSVHEKELMLQEIHHRVKNNLQIIESLISLQKRGLTERHVLDQIQIIAGRIGAMSALHSSLYREDSFGRVEMRDYIQSLVAQAKTVLPSSPSVGVELVVEDVELEVSHALPCGLILNEALSNVHRHAFPDGRGGTVRIALTRIEGDQLELTIRDNGVGLPDGHGSSENESMPGGVGLTLVEVLAKQLKGSTDLTSEKGVTLRVTFPMRRQDYRTGERDNLALDDRGTG